MPYLTGQKCVNLKKGFEQHNELSSITLMHASCNVCVIPAISPRVFTQISFDQL